MSLEKLRKSLSDEGKAEAKKIISEAEKEAARIAEEAKENAKRIKAEGKETVSSALKAENSERMSAAQLSAKKKTTEARNRMLEMALEEAWKEFIKIRGNAKAYEKFMKDTITESEKELGNKVTVFVNKQDNSLAKKISKNVDLKAVEITGGAIIMTHDKRISIDNSLEAIFEEKKEEIKSRIFSETKTK